MNKLGIHLLKPWPQRGIALVLGALGALAFAPLFIFPALLLSLSGIWFLLEQDIENKFSFPKIFWLGWWFGLGHFTAGLYWIANALTVDLAAFWWLIPFALFGVPAILAIFTGLSFMGTKLWPHKGISRAFAFAAIWVGVEWLRGHIFTGFPWNLAGYAWAFSPEMVQAASLAGVYGLSLLTLLMAISLEYLVGKRAFERNTGLSIYLICALCWVWGKGRLDHPKIVTSPPLFIRLVQPNIPQTLKWDPVQREDNFQDLLKITAAPSSHPLKAIIWPESAVPFFLEQEHILREQIAKIMPKGALLVTGAIRRTPPGKTPLEVWNSLLVLDDQGDIVTAYDKAHLVPFGEYLPFRKILDAVFGKGSLKKITAGSLDFSAGPGPETIPLPGGLPPFSGLVCYEVIFPSAVINPSQPRPGWMINITNDAWYGNTSGPYQHLEMARFRAIEEGVPLVRSANSGISAVFDSYGQNMGNIGLSKKGILDVFLPTPTRVVPFYARWGDWITLGLILCMFALAWVFSLKVRPRNNFST
jgi:apolipoprotein N-acyltransferase